MNENNKNNSKKEHLDKLYKIILLCLVLILMVLLTKSCYTTKTNPNDVISDNVTQQPTVTPLVISGEDWNGDSTTYYADEELEYITIPGYSLIAVTQENQEINLYNPPENTVYFIYAIMNESEEIVYQTDAIAPGKTMKWNVCDTFNQGTYNTKMVISTFDVTTQTPCYGANQTVTVIVQ